MQRQLLITLVTAAALNAADYVSYVPLPGNVPSCNGPGKPMDLCWTAVLDPNGIPLNPYWREQSNSLAIAPDVEKLCDNFRPRPLGCTDWKYDIDAVRPFTLLGIIHGVERIWHPHKLHGHVNWGAATYEGKLGFVDYEAGFVVRDHDYNLALDLSAYRRGLSPANLDSPLNGRLALEFKASEVIDRFKVNTWWSTLKDTVDRESSRLGLKTGDYPKTKDLVARALKATVIGLMGIDAEHVQTELHPVWGMAIQLSQSHWAVFARNWGGEGNLSGRQHYLELEKLCFLLREKGVAEFRLYDEKGNAVTPQQHPADGGVVVEIPLGPAKDRPIVYGEITLR